MKRCGAMDGVAARLDLRISERHMAVRTAFLVLGGGGFQLSSWVLVTVHLACNNNY